MTRKGRSDWQVFSSAISLLSDCLASIHRESTRKNTGAICKQQYRRLNSVYRHAAERALLRSHAKLVAAKSHGQRAERVLDVLRAHYRHVLCANTKRPV